MRSRDWALVLFTTLSQWSVGIILWFTLLTYLSDGGAVTAETGLSLVNPVFLALLLVGLATTVSFLHLGNPSNAPGALRNLSGSWLSREILAIGIYSLSLVFVFIYGWVAGASGVTKYLLLPCSVAGIFLLWTMARVYLIPTIPSWNSWYTPLSFVTATLCLGLITFLFLNTAGHAGLDYGAIGIYTGILAAILILETVSNFSHHSRLVKMETGFDGPVFNHGICYKLFLARTAMLIVASLAILFFLLLPDPGPGNGNFTWIYPVVLLAVIQEFSGRHLFYLSYFRLGI